MRPAWPPAQLIAMYNHEKPDHEQPGPGMASPAMDVLIVGAGIVGAALARSLGGSGLRIGLVEAKPIDTALPAPLATVSGFDARVSALNPASRALLETLGAWDGIAASACAYRRMSVWEAEGTGSIEFDAAELDVSALGYIVENQAIAAALLDGIDRRGDIALFNPARVSGLQLNEGDTLRLSLEDGRELSAHLLVAADGAQSRIRQMAGFKTREWNYGHRALVATVQTGQPHQATAYQNFLSTGPLALLPLPDREGKHFCSIVWSAEPALADQLQTLADGDFCAALFEASEGRLGDILAAGPRREFPLRQCHAINYVQSGIALVGDAAHSIHPLAGQGVNLGLQDVSVLAEELVRGHARGALPGDIALLRRYQRRRKGENLLMMAAMDGFKRLFESRSLPVRWARNAGMSLTGRVGPLKRRLMRHAMGQAP